MTSDSHYITCPNKLRVDIPTRICMICNKSENPEGNLGIKDWICPECAEKLRILFARMDGDTE